MGALCLLVRLASRVELWLTGQAMAAQHGAACSGTGVTLFLVASWLPTRVVCGAGLGLGLASTLLRGGSWLSRAALRINGAMVAWQVMELVGILPPVRHPCMR